MKKHIPDFITSLNLLCGCIALVCIFNGQIISACFLIFLAMIFDFFDGMAARLLKASSGIGKELDSLADVVSFGVVPGMVLYSFSKESMDHSNTNYGTAFSAFLLVLPFAVTIFSALRLAKFNVDTRQTKSFIGLPTPACALFVMSLPLIKTYQPSGFTDILFNNPAAIGLLSCMLSYLLVSPIPMLSLKFENLKWKDNSFRWILILTSILLLLVFQYLSFPFIIISYIILSILENILSKNPSNT